jgi:hypothetical protein
VLISAVNLVLRPSLKAANDLFSDKLMAYFSDTLMALNHALMAPNHALMAPNYKLMALSIIG